MKFVPNAIEVHPFQKRDNYTCQYFSKDGLSSLDNWHDSTIDHLIPGLMAARHRPKT